MMILTGEEYGRVQLMKNDRQNMLVSSSEGKGQYTHVSESQFFDLERTVGKMLSDYRIPVETTAWIEMVLYFAIVVNGYYQKQKY